MAKRTIIVDDLDGQEAVEGDEIDNHRFSLDGRSWEIDLSSTNYEGLDAALQPYIAAAREVSRSDRHRSRATKSRANGNGNGSTGGGAAVDSADDRREIRFWAAANGYKVAERGALPHEVVEAWRVSAGNGNGQRGGVRG